MVDAIEFLSDHNFMDEVGGGKDAEDVRRMFKEARRKKTKVYKLLEDWGGGESHKVERTKVRMAFKEWRCEKYPERAEDKEGKVASETEEKGKAKEKRAGNENDKGKSVEPEGKSKAKEGKTKEQSGKEKDKETKTKSVHRKRVRRTQPITIKERFLQIIEAQMLAAKEKSKEGRSKRPSKKGKTPTEGVKPKAGF